MQQGGTNTNGNAHPYPPHYAAPTPASQAGPGASSAMDIQLREALLKLSQLDAENVELRNTLMSKNDEIFVWEASSAVAQAETTAALENSIAKLQSELNFRVSDKRMK
jgi:hypothetical protein